MKFNLCPFTVYYMLVYKGNHMLARDHNDVYSLVPYDPQYPFADGSIPQADWGRHNNKLSSTSTGGSCLDYNQHTGGLQDRPCDYPGAYTSNKWYFDFPGAWTLDVKIGADGTVWRIDTDYGIWQLDPNSGIWSSVVGEADHIAVDPNGNPWVLGRDQTVYRWDPNAGGFLEVGGGLLDIAIGADGSIFGLALDNTVRKWDGNWWQHIEPHPLADHIAVDPNGNPWLLDSDQHPWRWSPGEFAQVGGGLLDIAISADGSIFGLALDNTVREWDGNWWQHVHPDFKAIAIGADPSGNPWVVGLTGALYRWDPAGEFIVVPPTM